MRKFSLFLYVYTLFVILWGAWVRISKSGDGCGESWPFCEGQVIPVFEDAAMWIEYSHRLSTGIFGLLVFYLLYRSWSVGDRLKKQALLIFFLTITESLLGAKLVLFGLVAENDSLIRLFAMSIHQINSLSLSASIFWYWHISQFPKAKAFDTRNKKILTSLYFILVASGALAALATSLFPAESLLTGLFQDLAPDAHFLERYRILHPILATIITFTLIKMYWSEKKQKGIFIPCIIVAFFFGGTTLLLLAPIWMKLTHLLFAHVLYAVMLRDISS